MDKGLHNSLFDEGECLSEGTLRAYANDQLSSNDKHLAEKHLLSCEMCSDALEGFQLLKNDGVLKELKIEVGRKYGANQGKVIPLNYRTYFAIAASIALLLVSVYIFKDPLNEDKVVADSSPVEEKAEVSDELNEHTITGDKANQSVAEKQASNEAQNKLGEALEPPPMDSEKSDAIGLLDNLKTEKALGVETEEENDEYISNSGEDADITPAQPSSMSGAPQSALTYKDKATDDKPSGIVENKEKLSMRGEEQATLNTISTKAQEQSKSRSKTETKKAYKQKRNDANNKALIMEAEESIVEAYEDVATSEPKLDTTDDGEEIFTIVEEMPQFPGGQKAMDEYFKKNLKYPQAAKDRGEQGTVYITFLINKIGEIENVKTIRGLATCPECDQEAVRVGNSMPKWEPGKQNGKAVNVRYNLPVRFKLP